MGVIYKLQPEIKEFLLNIKTKEPNLSCRKLAALIQEKFQIKLSKSRVNSVIKEAGLSMPVGRRRKGYRGTQETEGLGAILLKAADYLLGGSCFIAETAGNRLKIETSEAQAKTECLLYAQLKPDYWLCPLLNQRFSPEQILSYLSDLQQIETLAPDISNLYQEVRCVKVNLSDGSSYYLDGQLHTVWSTPNIPLDFSTTISNIKNYINKYFKERVPLALFMAPGYDTPTKEFFDFIGSLETVKKQISKLTLYGQKFEELVEVQLDIAQKCHFIFGLWPWQFAGSRKVNAMGEFKPFYFGPVQEDFYLANIEVELSQPSVNQKVTLKGCALKRNLDEKVKLIILSNFTQEKAPEELAKIYLNHWPNLEEAFRDYGRKIELFTYTAGSQRSFSTDILGREKEAFRDLKPLFEHYLEVLDLFVRHHFLPSGYEDKDFPTAKERFYSLGGRIKRKKQGLFITFRPPSGYLFLKDLEYACRRLNERGIAFAGGERIWFSV